MSESPQTPAERRAVIPYCEEIAEAICERVTAGESLRAICKPGDMPGAATVHRWAAVREDFARRLRKAQQAAREARVSRYRASRAERIWKRGRPWARPDAYDAGLGEEICRRIAEGQSMLEVCAAADMPVAGTVYEWLRNHDDFAEAYRRARRVQAELLADLAWEIARDASRESVPVARLQFDVIRWRASRLAPKAYDRDGEDEERRPFEVYVQQFSTGEILSGPHRG